MKHAFIKSIPILCSYVFVSMAYGIMMEEAGFHWYYSLLISLTVYTGAFQFVLITFLSSGASILTIALTALLMNSRQTFYSLTFIEEFKKMGKRLPYMIHTMTLEGIDFCMTALFVIIFIDQWEKSENHFPALLGIIVALISLYLFGPQRFMLVALLIVSGILLLVRGGNGKEVHCE